MAVTVATAQSGGVSGSYRGFDWVSGERVPSEQIGIRFAKLSLSVTLADIAHDTQPWVASVDCVVQTSDGAELAYELGALIGRNIGTNVQGKKL